MADTHRDPGQGGSRSRGVGCLPLAGILAAVIVVTALVTAWWVKHYLYASPFTPTQLSGKEKTVLNAKLRRLEAPAVGPGAESPRPEAYSEAGASREVRFTEKELNALIANDEETARRVAVDLSDDLVSVKVVAPMDPEIPLIGGKTLRLNVGVRLAYARGRPVVAFQGVSLGGVPLPNAWLGDLKYKNLVQEFGSEQGFWKRFADGVEDLRVRDGRLEVRLKE